MRRKLLVTVALVLALVNVAYFALVVPRASDNERPARWLAYMPELEAYQRANPDNTLRSSHINDPRYPWLSEGSGPNGVSILSKVAGVCRIDSYVIRQKPVSLHQMPDRLFLGELSREQNQCIRAQLPQGYQLHEFRKRMDPANVDWSEDPARYLKSTA